MKFLKSLIIISLLIVQMNSEPFIIIGSLVFQILSFGVAVTATILIGALKLKVVITSIKIFSFKSQIDGLKSFTGSIANFVIEEAHSDLLAMKVQAINDSKDALAKYSNFQKTSEPVCRNFFTDKIQKLFYNGMEKIVDIDKIKNELIPKNIIKSIKNPGEPTDYFLFFKFNEIININGLKEGNISIISQGIEEIKEEIYNQVEETKQEIKESVQDSILKATRETAISAMGLADIEGFVNNIRTTVQGYNEVKSTIEDIQHTYNNLGEVVKNKLSEEAVGVYESLKSGAMDTKNWISEKYSTYFGEEPLEEDNENFMCDMIYAVSISTETAQLCINIDFIDSTFWDQLGSYESVKNLIGENNNTKQICFVKDDFDEMNNEVDQVNDENEAYQSYLNEQWENGFYAYYNADPIEHKKVISKFSIFYNSFKSLYSFGYDDRFVTSEMII